MSLLLLLLLFDSIRIEITQANSKRNDEKEKEERKKPFG